MNNGDDELIFAEDEVAETGAGGPMPVGRSGRKWKLMVIDDDADVQTLTKLVLRNFTFEGRGLEFITGFSGADAKRLMREHPDTAVLLLDVVMEREQAGLEAVRYIREELHNQFVRIILRTGQPGQAPEQDVITGYDINDYKEKSELTEQKLVTVVIASLRSYQDICIIEENRRGLEKIIHATGTLFEPRSIKKLATGVLMQLSSILELDESALYVKPSGFAARWDRENGQFRLFAGTGAFADRIGAGLEEAAPSTVLDLILKASQERESIFSDNIYVGYFTGSSGSQTLIYLKGNKILEEIDRQLIQIFSSNVGLAFENVYLNREIMETQREITFTLGEVIETRTNKAGNHVRRVADSARLLAKLAGLDDDDVELLWLASPLHDLGKVGVPDTILNKPGELDEAEWGEMKEHASIGFQILKGSNRRVLHAGSIIASQHHERWDGTGYPQRLEGKDIHIFARIVALIDVFDALSHDRCHKKAWEPERVIDFIKGGRGKRFDPALVDLLLNNVEQFRDIQRSLADKKASKPC